MMPSPRPQAKALGLEHVVHRYGAGGPPVLQHLDCTITAGELVCVLGPSGCGKTTLLHLIAGFMAPTSGRVLCGGVAVSGPGPDRGMVFQEPTLFPWLTVRGNVEFGLRRAGVRGPELHATVLDHLARMGLADHAARYPHVLSGGMRQRVALARVLALAPSVLLLDEPFSALDLPTRERLQDELLSVWADRSCTVVYVTHSVEEAAYLGERILLFPPCGQGRPYEVPVALPHPRQRLGPDTLALEAHLRGLLRQTLC